MPELGIGLPRTAEEIGVVAESGAPLIRAGGKPTVIDENVVGGIVGIVKGVSLRVDLGELERGDERRIGGDAVEADVDGGVVVVEEEIGVGAGAGDGFGPRGSPGKDESALEGDVEGGGVGFAVEVVVDVECAEEVAGLGGGGGDGVAILLAGGDGEVAESLLLLVEEEEGLGDHGGGAAGVEAVGEPGGVEGVGGIDESAAVNVHAVV